jgi:hypothetical protein
MKYVLVIAAFIACTCNPPRPTTSALAGESYPTLTNDGAWCWFSDPRAVNFSGKYNRTYTGWVDSSGNIVVGSYDHDSKEIQTHVIHPKLQKDDHNNPALFMDARGKLMAFYSKHATTDPIYVVQAKNPENISEWESRRALELNDSVTYSGLSDTYTYANICQLSEENKKLYLFWRGADFKPNFSVSADEGKTWTKGKILILPERIYRNRRPYYKIASNNRDVIHFAFTDGHPNAEPTNSIYYMKYREAGLYKANGDKIADWSDVPVQPRQTDVVYDATNTSEKAWIWDVAENTDGNPVIVYSRFPDDSTHVYYYSIFNNNRWSSYKLVNSGKWFPQTPAGKKETEQNYSGGVVLDPNDPSNVYLSVMREGNFEIEKWSTADKGKSWRSIPVTSGSRFDNVRPFVVRNEDKHDSATLLWMNIQKYVHWTDYRASIKVNNQR